MRKKQPYPEGFTLLEILIAISLTAVLVGIVFAALRLSQRSEEKGRERQEAAQRMRAVSDRLSFLIRGAYPLFAQEEEKVFLLFDGSPEKLAFVTSSTDEGDALEDLPGLKKVTISSGPEGLKITEGIFFMDEKEKEYVMDPELSSLKFEYLEVNEEDQSSSWVSSWDSYERTNLPFGVRMTFELKQGGKEYRVPPVVVPLRARAAPSPFEEGGLFNP